MTKKQGPRILVVERDDGERRRLKHELQRAGYAVKARGCGTGLDGVVEKFPPDLALVGSCGRGPKALDLCHWFRQLGSTSVVMLAATRNQDECLACFAAGADDYVCRPFDIRELLARVKAILGRLGRLHDGLLTVGDIEIDRNNRTVSRNHRRVDLTPTEFDILLLLASNRENPLSPTEIVSRLGRHGAWDSNVLQVHVSSLRRKLQADRAPVIHTLRRVGYVLRPA